MYTEICERKCSYIIFKTIVKEKKACTIKHVFILKNALR